MGIPAPTELLLILGIVIMVFGAKRIPEIMGGLGQGIKTFKKSMESDEPTATAGSAEQRLPPSAARPTDAAGIKSEPR